MADEKTAKGKRGGPRPGSGRKRSEAAKLRSEYLNKQHAYAVEALEYQVAVMRNDSQETKDRLTASKLIQDRVWGKAKQSIVLGVPDEGGETAGHVVIGFARLSDA